MMTTPVEDKIYSALEKAAAYHLEGLDPHESVAKAANEYGLNPEMTCRVVEMFNIAKTHHHMKAASDKTVSFPTADRATVLKKAFTEVTPETQEPKVGNWIDDRSIKAEPMQKQAGAEEAPIAPAIGACLLETLVPRLDSLVSEFQDRHSKTAQAADDCFTRGVNALHKMASYFNSSTNVSEWDRFERELISEYPEGKTIADLVHKNAGLTCTRTDPGLAKLEPRHPLHSFAREMIDASHKHAELAKQLDEDERQAELAARARLEILSKVAGINMVPEVSAADLVSGDLQTACAADPSVLLKTGAEGGGSGVQEMFVNPAVSGVQKAVTSEVAKATQHSMEEPYKVDAADKELQDARRAAILTNVIQSDPILQEKDPAALQSAYESLAALSPAAAQMPEVVRSVLRSASTQQAMDPFTATQIAKLEGAVLQNKNLASGSAAPIKE
jgi:hypothetical protein